MNMLFGTRADEGVVEDNADRSKKVEECGYCIVLLCHNVNPSPKENAVKCRSRDGVQRVARWA